MTIIDRAKKEMEEILCGKLNEKLYEWEKGKLIREKIACISLETLTEVIANAENAVVCVCGPD